MSNESIMKKGTKVVVCKDQPDFNKAVCAYPNIGSKGIVVVDDDTPKGKVCVRFSAKQFDYIDLKYIKIYCWEWALEKA